MGFRTNRALARTGFPELWDSGPGRMLEPGERPISYAHYQLDIGAEIVGMFLTDRHLFMLNVIDMAGNYDQRPGIALSDLALVGRVGRRGGWAFTQLRRPTEPGQSFVTTSWLLYPRQALAARMVSRTFLAALAGTLGSPPFVRWLKLSRHARLGGHQLDEEMLALACGVNSELRELVEAEAAEQHQPLLQEEAEQRARDEQARKLAEEEASRSAVRQEHARREAGARTEEHHREARLWRTEGSPEKRRRRAEWQARQARPAEEPDATPPSAPD